MRPARIVFFVFLALLLSGLMLGSAGFRDAHAPNLEKGGERERCIDVAKPVAGVLSANGGGDLNQVVAEHPEYLFRVGCTSLRESQSK